MKETNVVKKTKAESLQNFISNPKKIPTFNKIVKVNKSPGKTRSIKKANSIANRSVLSIKSRDMGSPKQPTKNLIKKKNDIDEIRSTGSTVVAKSKKSMRASHFDISRHNRQSRASRSISSKSPNLKHRATLPVHRSTDKKSRLKTEPYIPASNLNKEIENSYSKKDYVNLNDIQEDKSLSESKDSVSPEISKNHFELQILLKELEASLKQCDKF